MLLKFIASAYGEVRTQYQRTVQLGNTDNEKGSEQFLMAVK